MGGSTAVLYQGVATLNLDNAAAVDAIAGPDTADRATAFTGLTANERFVQTLYLDDLGRGGSKAELDGWLLSVNGRTLSRLEIATDILHSQEAEDHLVKSWYLTYLGRPAVGGEEQGWVNMLLQGAPEEAVLTQILSSAEFYNRAQSLAPGGTAQQNYVQALYMVLLHRQGSAAEIQGWVNMLATVGEQGVALAILQSQECRAYCFEGYYNALLHRPGDPAGLASWVTSNLDAATVLADFEGSAEFYSNG